VICQRNRTEFTIQESEIIQISQDCIIKIRSLTLTPKLLYKSIPVLSSAWAPLNINITDLPYTPLTKPIGKEEVVKLFERPLVIDDTPEELHPNIWRHVRAHSAVTSISLSLSCLLIAFLLYKCWTGPLRNTLKKSRAPTTLQSPDDEARQPVEEIRQEVMYAEPIPTRRTREVFTMRPMLSSSGGPAA
ncbi:hypothetical protein HHI36_002812, partial [Cryptolaemus montrouzieri]